MTYQDEVAWRLGHARGAGTGAGRANRPCEERSDAAIQGGERRTGLLRPDQVRGRNDEQTDERENRHPEPGSGPRASEPADGGKTDEILNQVQDDELIPPSRLREGPGVGLGETASGASDSISTPTPNLRHDGWLPEIRVQFLEALARTGNIGVAALYVHRSGQSAYDLKRRDPDFARAWLAALVLARDVAEDALQERAMEGVEEEVFYHGEVIATRRRYDSRLLLAHLARLDRVAEQIPAQRGAARFGAMLDAIGRGEDTAPLVATPTEDELAALAAEAEQYSHRQPPEEEGDEFHMVTWPDEHGPPELLRMCPEEVEHMQREIPGIVITPTGTRDDEVVEHLINMAWYRDHGDYSEKEDEDDDVPAEGEGKNL